MNYTTTLRACALAAALALSACTTTPKAVQSQDVPPPPPFPEKLEDRAQARWDLLVSRNASRAYDLLAPGARSQVTREEYAASFGQRPVTWLGAKVAGKKCDGDTCTVKVEVRYKAEIPQSSAGAIESTAYLEESWIRTGGEWLLVPERPSGGVLR